MSATKTKLVTSYHFIDPLYVIAQLEIKPGNIVADFGCGAGFFSLPLAQAVGQEGIVYSLDILPQALESVISRAKLLGISNIIVRQVNLENVSGSKLPDESIDWVIIKDMLFQNKNRKKIIAEAHRVLKPDGKALIVEWNKNNLTIGPDKKLRVSPEEIMKLTEEQKFSVDKIIKAGNFHYGFVISKKNEKKAL